MTKLSGLLTCTIVFVFCAVLLVPLSVVDVTWHMLRDSIQRYGLTASVPNAYALYLLGLLVALSILKLYVEDLGLDASKRMMMLAGEAIGQS